MSEEKPPVPIEIPWKLASTTQPLVTGEPNQTSVSMFVFEPDEDKLTGEFPHERLIYLKFTVTVSPASFPDPQTGTALGEGVPCFHLLLDLKVSKADGGTGTIRPYFHSAVPLHRTMIESGAVGVDVYEGESDQQFMGKSGSQMYESSTSSSRTSSKSAGGTSLLPIPLIPTVVSGSMRTTSTDVSAQRGVSQIVDTTERQASEERRELTSHSTKVENVLTLLNAKYIGTPYMRFSLSPRPLHLLSVDTSDPNIWYSQLLQRRSSGIEGIQEFTTVLLVPKGQDFCVNAKLQRICMLDNPPGPLTYSELYNGSPQQRVRLLNYLNHVYPPGTPLDDLDVDITDTLFPPIDPDNPDPLIRPCIEIWFITFVGSIVWATVVSPSKTWLFGLRAASNYKHAQEVWLETLRDEYEREVARSPLERGVILGDELFLDTCFSFDDDGEIDVTSSNFSATPLGRIVFDPSKIDFGGISSTTSPLGKSIRENAFAAITRWNLLENRMAILLGNQIELSASELRFDDEDIVSLHIDRWAKLDPKSKDNHSFEEVIKKFLLNENYRRLLKEAGVTDLKTLAQAIKSAPELEKYESTKVEYDLLIKPRKIRGKDKAQTAKVMNNLIKPVKFPISSKDAANIREVIGKALQNNFTISNSKK